MIGLKYTTDAIYNKRELIKKSLFEKSNFIKTENFTKISDYDLYILFALYDEIFLDWWFKKNFKGKIKFTLSRQLTRAAGNTRTKKNIAVLKPEEVEFEVKISLNHLADFDKVDRIKYVGGIEVNSKLDSLMLVLEHELCHVIEFILCNKSSCSKKPFKDLIYNLFGQTESNHKLTTKKEVIAQEYGLKPGDNVTFEFECKKSKGIISRINKRATVMVLDKKGNYVDTKGNHYKKFYVPLSCLNKL